MARRKLFDISDTGGADPEYGLQIKCVFCYIRVFLLTSIFCDGDARCYGIQLII